MTKDECREMVEACVNHGTLTRWESEFLVTIGTRLDRGRPLTADQEDKLEEIYNKIYGER
jgi:hypothetical protein